LDRFTSLLADGESVGATRYAENLERSSVDGDQVHVQVGGLVDSSTFTEWILQALNLVRQVAGEDSPYYGELEACKTAGYPGCEMFVRARAALRAASHDYESGFLVDFRELAAGEVFTDFLDMAKHLAEQAFNVPAASLAGAVLEDALRRSHVKRVGSLEGASKISRLNDGLRKAGVYTRPQWRQIQAWGDLPNAADHGRFDEVDSEDVERMIAGLQDFLAKYSGG